MTLQSKFLTLSMKEQIFISIIVLTCFSILVILCLTCSFSYEILKEDYKQKQLYFYDKYREYIESCFYVQNFKSLQYEEIIKRMQTQIWIFHQSTQIYNFEYNFNQKDNQIIEDFIFSGHGYESITKKKTSQNNDVLFFACYYNNGINMISQMCGLIYNNIKSYYLPLSSMIMTHDIYDSFRLPGYDEPIFSSPIIASINRSSLFSFNSSKIYETLKEILGETEINYLKFNTYYEMKIKYILGYVTNIVIFYLSKQIHFFDHLFRKVFEEIDTIHNLKSLNPNDLKAVSEFAKKTSGYYSSIDYSTEKFSLLSYVDGSYFYCETNIINDFLYNIHNKLSNFLDISFIPLFSQNNTVLSPDLCILFLLRQSKYKLSKEEINLLYKKIIKGKSTIEDCFLNNNTFKDQIKVKEVFDLNFKSFFDIDNVINQGLIDGPEYPLYYIKYAYPNYNVLKDFQSDYFLLDQIDYYFFISFKEPVDFANNILKNNRNCFFFIVMIVIYIWVIGLFVNIIIYNKVVNQLIDPIQNLQDAVESSSYKDENIFKYECDDFINDLFLTCKELLSGKIAKNENEKGVDKFDILSVPQDKQKTLDKNKYKKNWIINKTIMNQLMNQQQNMNDFSQNIKINEELEFNDFEENIQKEKSDNSRQQFQDENIPLLNTDNNEINNTFNKNDININKINEEKDRIPYRKLFQISNFLYYHINKVEDNRIHLFNYSSNDGSKTSKISKISSNNINESLNINSKLKKKIIREESLERADLENFTINMLNNRNITYLWYMEEKKKKNISFNYNVNNNYDELFLDNNPYQNNNII